jgi:hypothetical protein
MRGLLVMMALAVCWTAPAAAQEATWLEIIGRASPIPGVAVTARDGVPGRNPGAAFVVEAPRGCDIFKPDSLYLVSPDERVSREYVDFIVAYPDSVIGRNQGDYIWPPEKADTLAMAVSEMRCNDFLRSPQLFVLERGGRYLMYYARTSDWSYPGLRMKLPNGQLSRLTWVGAENRFVAQAEVDAEEERATRAIRQEFVAKWRKMGWSQRAIDAVLAGKIYLGMNKDMVIEAWGRPDDINRTIVPGKTHEQWVYGLGSYVYFENGIVTAIQN